MNKCKEMLETFDNGFSMLTHYGLWLRKGKEPSTEPLNAAEQQYANSLLIRGGGLRRFRIKQCFANSQRLATEADYFKYADPSMKIQYWEGFFINDRIPIPVKHAWLTINGKVWDVTAAALKRKNKRDKLGDSGNNYYWGVTIPYDTVRKNMLKSGCYESLTDYPSKFQELIGITDEELETMKNERTQRTQSR